MQVALAKQTIKQQVAKAVVPQAKPELVHHLRAPEVVAEPKLLAATAAPLGAVANQALPEPSAQVAMVGFSQLLLAVAVAVATMVVAAAAATTAVLAQMAAAAAAVARASTLQGVLAPKASKLVMAKL